jgi:hypothetical protein
MEAANTQPNRALAQAVNSRITADAVMLKAKSTLWRLTGVGAMCALIGLGVGAGFFGYSYIHDPRTSAQKMAQAFAEALEKSTLRGEVKLDPHAAVKLDPNGAQVNVDPTSTIRLDASGTVVRLDPNAMVNVRGVTAEVPRPPDRQTNPDTAPSLPRGNVVTDYTVFKTVKYGNGEVVTGWNFTSNKEDSPRHEYCYYAESIRDGVVAQFTLAQNGQLDLKGAPPPNVDRTSAAANCVWFGGGSTRSY